jgi:Spy/CpxP family protein refolding chaperone
MTSKLKIAGMVAMLTIGLATAPGAIAQDDSMKGGGMMGRDGMMGGGMMGTMNMMQQMSEMMNTCNKMMRSMTPQHAPQTPQEEKSPEKKG